jgi:hypothetical protein
MSDRFDAALPGAAAFGRGHSQHDEWVWVELELIRERWRAARHPFFVALARGELTAAELAAFFSDNDHVVVALAAAAHRATELSDGLLGDALARHASCRDDQVASWRALASIAGWGGASAWYYGEDPHESTRICARLIAAACDLDLAAQVLTLQTMACTERELRALVEPALRDHYGLQARRTTAHFDAADPADCDVLQAVLEGLLLQSDPFALLRRAEAVARSYWHLLDDLEAHRHPLHGARA